MACFNTFATWRDRSGSAGCELAPERWPPIMTCQSGRRSWSRRGLMLPVPRRMTRAPSARAAKTADGPKRPVRSFSIRPTAELSVRLLLDAPARRDANDGSTNCQPPALLSVMGLWRGWSPPGSRSGLAAVGSSSSDGSTAPASPDCLGGAPIPGVFPALGIAGASVSPA
jgi:hypothetical protein